MAKAKASEPRPLRMAVIEPSGQLYGSELSLLDILRDLDRRRFKAEVLLPRRAPLADLLRRHGIPFRRLLPPARPLLGRTGKTLGYCRMAWRLAWQRPDMIYVSQAGVLRPAAAVALRLGIPVACQVTTLEDARWAGSLRFAHDVVFAFVCNSRFTAEAADVPPERKCVVYRGYRPKDLGILREGKPLDPDRLTVGLLGRICELKGHYFVIEAARRLKTQGSSEFRFRFIGEAATPAESSAARRLVRDSGLADWIEFRGYRADIGEELARIDALAIPSVGEAFGRILCEAAEADVPVVLGDSGGLGELSRRFDIGLRFPPRDLNGFLGVLGRVRAEYGRVAAEFRVAAKRLLDALDLHAYSRVMEGVFVQVAARRPVSVVWTGEEKEQGPCASST